MLVVPAMHLHAYYIEALRASSLATDPLPGSLSRSSGCSPCTRRRSFAERRPATWDLDFLQQLSAPSRAHRSARNCGLCFLHSRALASSLRRSPPGLCGCAAFRRSSSLISVSTGVIAGRMKYPCSGAFHQVHSRPRTRVLLLISARAHPIDNAFIRLCGLIPHLYHRPRRSPERPQGTLVATLLMLFTTVWGFFHPLHQYPLALRLLEWLLATPAFHLWHHTLTGPRNRNFSSSLPCWDWLFGTAYLPKGCSSLRLTASTRSCRPR